MTRQSLHHYSGLYPFDMPAWLEGKVHLDHHVVVKGNFYSLPTQFIGTKVQIRLGLKTVRLYQDHQLLKTHVRAYDKGQWITDSNDYNVSAREHLDMTPEACLGGCKSLTQVGYLFYVLQNFQRAIKFQTTSWSII